jgi:type II secretory pathway pseudopilin PulG
MINLRFKIQNRSGFTLIELILYIALLAIFITGAIYFTWDVIYGREKAFQQQIVDQSTRIAMERIAYEIRRAKDIQSVSVGQIILDNDGSTTEISLVGDAVQIISGGSGPFDLTSSQVRVTSLTFVDLSSSSLDPAGEDSNNIGVSLVIEQAQAGVSGHLTASTTVVESIELNSQFNQSRRLLVNLSGASLVSGTSLEGMTAQNTGTNDVIIDQLRISWTGTSGGENITEVQIGGGAVEWAGSQGTGSTIDLNDFTLTTASGVVNVDYFTFDSDMSGATINYGFVLSDGSVARSKLTLQAGGSPTPTPTPTTEPYSTCSELCLGSGYSSGTCRQNAKACSDNGETYESGGDQYCTGGPNSDTCCCAP